MRSLFFPVLSILLVTVSGFSQAKLREVDLRINGIGSGSSYGVVVAKFGKPAAVADIPIGEMAMPEEIAEVISFVLRSSQRSLNGATLDMNGGSYIR